MHYISYGVAYGKWKKEGNWGHGTRRSHESQGQSPTPTGKIRIRADANGWSPACFKWSEEGLHHIFGDELLVKCQNCINDTSVEIPESEESNIDGFWCGVTQGMYL